MPIETRALRSVSAWLPVISRKIRKSLPLAGYGPAGDRKIKVWSSPRTPNVVKDHLSLQQGMETVTGMAPPHRGTRSGWMSAPHLCLLNYDCSASSLYETQTQTIDYRGEEEAARLEPLRSVTNSSTYNLS